MLRPETRTLRDRAEAGTVRPWFDHAVLAVALGTLLLGYTTVVQGRDWWVTTALVCALVGLVCAGLRFVGFRWVAPAALAVGALALTWIFVPQTLLGPLPTWSSATGLWSMLDRAQVLIMEEAAPAAAARPVVLVLAGAFGLVVVVADVLLRRRLGALLVGALLVGVYATPALVSGRTPSVWLFVVPAALWLLLLRSRTQARGTGGLAGLVPATVLGAAAVVVGVTLPPVLPDVTAVANAWGKPPPEVFGRGINPMLQLGQNLRRNSTAVAARYTTTYEDAPYLKVAVLRDFSGRTWRPAQSRPEDRFEGRIGLDPDVEVVERRTAIRIADLRSTMLPVPYPAQDVSGLEGGWSWQRAGQTVSSRTSDTRGQTYAVTSLDVQPTANQMRTAETVVGPSLRSYVSLPEDVPEVVRETAREVTRGARNDYDRAMALQDFLRSDFTYSESAPVAGDYDGNGVRVLADFLRERAGYCVHFSSAMAVMARDLGIPSRVAVGYAPGRVTGLAESGRQEYEVTSDDLHAWPELYFDGIGWVSFEPTPGVGRSTAFQEPESAGSPEDAEAEGATEEQRRADAAQREGAVAEVAADDAGATAPRSAVVVGAGLLLVLLSPAAVRQWLRRRRLRQGLEDTDALWRELEATAVDVGLPVGAADTPRGLATRLAASPSVPQDELDRLLHGVEVSRYARPGTDAGTGHRGAAEHVIDGLRSDASRLERLRALLLPRSFLRAQR